LDVGEEQGDLVVELLPEEIIELGALAEERVDTWGFPGVALGNRRLPRAF
jgi:hypothetical protein